MPSPILHTYTFREPFYVKKMSSHQSMSAEEAATDTRLASSGTLAQAEAGGSSSTNVLKTDASLTGKKEQLKTQLLLVDQQRSASDQLRAEIETTKAQTAAILRETEDSATSVTTINTDLEKVVLQQQKMTKSRLCLESFRQNMEIFQQRQVTTDQDLANQLENLSLEFDTQTRAKQEDQRKVKEYFDESFLRVFQAERKGQVESLEHLNLALRRKEEEMAEKMSRLQSLNSEKELQRGKLDRAGMETEGLEWKKASLIEEAGKVEVLKVDLQNFGDIETNEKKEMKFLEESHGLKETELKKITEDVKVFKDEGAEIMVKRSYLKTFLEESLEKKKRFEVKQTELSSQSASLCRELQRLESLKRETELLTSQHKEAVSILTATKERMDCLLREDALKLELDNETLKLSQEVHELESKVEASRAQVAGSKEKLKEVEKEVNDLETSLRGLSAEKEEVVKLMKELKEKSNVERASLLLQVNDGAEKEERILSVKREVEGLKQKNGNIEKSLKIWRLELDTAKAKFRTDEEEIKEMANTNKVLRTDLEAKRKETGDAEGGNMGKARIVWDKKSEEVKLKKELEDAADQLKKLTKDINLGTKQLEKKEKDHLLRCSEASGIDEQIGSTASEIEAISREIVESQEALEKLDEAQESVEGMKEVFKSLEAESKKMKKDIISSKKSLTTAVKSREKVEKQHSKLSSTNADMKLQLEQLAENVNNSRGEVQKIKEKKNAFDQEMKAFEDMSSAGDNKVEDVEKKQRLDELKLQREEDLKKCINEYEGILGSRERDFSSNLSQLERVVKEREELVQAMSRELEGKQRKKKESLTMKGSDEAPQQQLQVQVEEARARLQALEKEVSEVKGSAPDEAAHPPSDPPQTPARKFFKTPRSSPVYRSSVSPSPQKKGSVGAQVKRSPLITR